METSQKETYIHIPVSCSNITIARTKIEYPQEDSNFLYPFIGGVSLSGCVSQHELL